MDDDIKDFKRGKPQQKLYKPGSGPLRRSDNAQIFENKMDLNELGSNSRGREQNLFGSQLANDMDTQEHYNSNFRHRKPEQQLYIPRSGEMASDINKQPKHSNRNDMSSQYNYNNRRLDKHGSSSGTGSYSRGASRKDFNAKDNNSNVNYNRQYRQVSEPRSSSPAHSAHYSNNIDRNRDSRSMETSAGRHASGTGGKPPSGRRNSAGYSSDLPRPKYINLDNIPPRFRKKYLEQSGYHSYDSVDQLSKDQFINSFNIQHINDTTSPNWSQTLPSRGRGRLRDNENFDREKFVTSYLKNYELDNSRRSTPSSSYMNLYEPNSSNKVIPATIESVQMVTPNQNSSKENGINDYIKDVTHSFDKSEKAELQTKDDIEGASSSSTNLLDNTSNLDWTEEVEKNIKLDDTCDSSVSYPQSFRTSSVSQDAKPNESREPKKSGRNGRRRDKRSLSRGKRNSEKRERNRKDSNVSIHEETSNNDLKHFERERRDSHRSNRSSTIGNSRDDLDRWRSLRSYSREQSTEGRIISQCNSRDTSISRAVSPRDSDGFRVPNSVSKGGVWSSSNQKKNMEKNGSWSGRTPSIERGRRSPMNESGTAEASASSSSSGHRSRKSRSNRPRRRARAAENAASHAPAHNPPAHNPPAHQQTAHHPPAHHPTGHNTPAPAPHPPAAPSTLNWREEILESKKHMLDRHSESTNQKNKTNGNVPVRSHTDSSTSHPGLIVLPPSSMSHIHKDQGRTGSGDSQKLLYDYNNPSKPIVVQTSTTKMDTRMERPSTERSLGVGGATGGSAGGEGGEAARAARHRALLQEVERADALLQAHSLRGPLALADHWYDVSPTRKCLQNALQKLLMSDLKYCQSDNVEHNFWKILYYNFIEILRDSLMHISPEDKAKVVNLLNTIIEEGNTYFENLVHLLEQAYKFNTDDYINDNHVLPPKGLGYVGLALISVQKLYIFLGDLARYKEQVNGTHNYAKSKFWYTRAQLINPKNGRPYNQLAILAIYARRKLDAVYYYMRSLMSSNPFQSARESLLSLFDENRKKYEAAEKKRRAAAQSASATEGEGAAAGIGAGAGAGAGRGYRREVWVRPSGRRTTTLSSPAPTDEDLYKNMTPVELNKNFITTYLHVHGKLITKIGMETFHESARQMLQQFRALLHRQPLPTPAARLLQLTALNMFAVETTASASKDKSVVDRSAWLECAVGVSLLMFGALLERCCALLPQPPHTQHYADALLLLPAIKVWSDWMLCHSSIWNPPPSFDSFQIESEQDPWDWLAKLMNILEDLDDKSIELENEPTKGDVCVRLGEDAVLAGFTPLMYIEPAMAVARVREPEAASAPGAAPAPAPASLQLRAEHALRTRKILFFGTEYLVGVEPPVLRLEYPADAPPRYVSAVQRAPQTHPPLQHLSEESEEEEEESARLSASGSENVSGSANASVRATLGEGEGDADADEATRRLLRRVHQLETRRDHLEKRRQRVQEILSGAGGWVSEEVEVRPRWLVPDTNCFIDHLPLLRALAAAPLQPYTLVVPLVVVSELEGLGRCSRRGDSARAALAWVTGASGGAAASVKFATSRGSVLPTAAFAEGDAALPRVTNDDRVLATALALHANLTAQPENKSEECHGGEAGAGGACRSVSVVLLTDDRNLRVKALAADLPARDLRSFVHWAQVQTEPDSAEHK